MKQICLYFEIHQPVHLKRYRFFDIGKDHYYYDDYENERSIRETAEGSYVPTLTTILDMCRADKSFRTSFSLSGVAIEMLEQYAPEVIDLLTEIAKTGQAEFLAEPYSHGLGSLGNEDSFKDEVRRQAKRIKDLFGQTPKIIRNSNLIYNDEIGSIAAEMGYKGIMVEGAKHILGWKSPHYVYSCATDNRINVLMRDYKLSDDICLRFSDSSWSEFPLMADKYVGWIAGMPKGEDVINIGMELCAIGMFQPLSSHILDFIKALPSCARTQGISFATPSEIIAKNKSVGPIEVPYAMSWNDEERDTSGWLGNTMQREAFAKLYDEKLVGRILACKDRRIKQDWDRLQATNNFQYMTTKAQAVPLLRANYDSAFDAFTNYMNILGDFLKRVKDMFSEQVENDELNALYTQIANLGDELNVKENEISTLRARLEKYEAAEHAAVTKKTPAKKSAPAKKAAVKKSEAKKPVTEKAPVKETVTANVTTEKPVAKKTVKKKTEVKPEASKKDTAAATKKNVTKTAASSKKK